jgi:predicted site-specific integrase-resolvase
MNTCISGHLPNGHQEDPMAAIFYARVSTADQNLDHQITQARSAGFHIDEVVADVGVS